MATSKSILIAVRVTPEIAAALDRLGQNAKLHTPVGPISLPARSLTRTEALRIAAEVGLRSLGMLGTDTAPVPTSPRIDRTAESTPRSEEPKQPTTSNNSIDGDTDALRVRFREALDLKKTSINKSAEPAGCSITPLRQWLNKGKELDPLYRANLAKHLDRIGA